MRLLIPSLLALGLLACSPPPQADQPALSFSADAGTYRWSEAHGARGGLILSRETSGGGGVPVLVIACDNLRTGGLQARMFQVDPFPAELVLTAGTAVMSVPARPVQVGAQAALEGDGALPSDWAGALGAAGTLRLVYGDQGVEVQGPTPGQAAGFGRYCRELDARRG